MNTLCWTRGAVVPLANSTLTLGELAQQHSSPTPPRASRSLVPSLLRPSLLSFIFLSSSHLLLLLGDPSLRFLLILAIFLKPDINFIVVCTRLCWWILSRPRNGFVAQASIRLEVFKSKLSCGRVESRPLRKNMMRGVMIPIPRLPAMKFPMELPRTAEAHLPVIR